MSPATGRGHFELTFPSGDGKPAAVVSFDPADINDRLGIAIDVANRGNEPVRIFADLNGDTWVRGYATIPAGARRTVYVFARRLKLSDADAARFPMMHGIPGGKMSLWAGIAEPVTASSVRIFVVTPRTDALVEAGNIRPFGSSKAPESPDYFPFVDWFGQFNHKEWPGKTHAAADLAVNARTEDLILPSTPARRAAISTGAGRRDPK